MLLLLEGPVSVQVTEDRRKKGQHPAGMEPTNSLLHGKRPTAVRSTAVLQPLPKNLQLITLNFFSHDLYPTIN